MQDILKQITTMDLNQVNQVKETVLNRLDSLKGNIRSTLIVGQTIRVNHPKAQGKQFKIIKLNNVKAKCVQIYPVASSKIEFTVPYSLIKTV